MADAEKKLLQAQHQMCIRDRVIDVGLCRLFRHDIAFSVHAGLDLIAVIPHPMGTGLRKQIVHNAVPLNS